METAVIRDHRRSTRPLMYLSRKISIMMQNPDIIIKAAAIIFTPLKCAVLFSAMIETAEINAARVTGIPTGKNHPLSPVIMSINNSAVRIASITEGINIKGFLLKNRKSVTIIQIAAIETSLISDQTSLLLISRSTIVQTAIPEKAIIPVNSQRYLLLSFLWSLIIPEGVLSGVLSFAALFTEFIPHKGHISNPSSSSTPQLVHNDMILNLTVI